MVGTHKKDTSDKVIKHIHVIALHAIYIQTIDFPSALHLVYPSQLCFKEMLIEKYKFDNFGFK